MLTGLATSLEWGKYREYQSKGVGHQTVTVEEARKARDKWIDPRLRSHVALLPQRVMNSQMNMPGGIDIHGGKEGDFVLHFPGVSWFVQCDTCDKPEMMQYHINLTECKSAAVP